MIELRSVNLKQGFRFELRPGRYVVGRDAGCDIEIPHESISRKHAVLDVDVSNRLTLSDLSSTNGSLVNGKPVSGSIVVKGGDFVTFGEVTCALRGEGTASATAQNVILRESAFSIPENSIVPLDKARTQVKTEDRFSQIIVGALSQLGSLLVGADDPQRLYEESLRLLIRSLGTERAFILHPPGSGEDDLLIASHIASPPDSGETVISRTILKEVADKRAVVMCPDIEMDSRFADAASVISQGLRTVLAMPLMDQEELVAVLYTDTMSKKRPLTKHHQQVFTIFGDMIASKMVNWTLVKENETKAVVEKELEVTKKKQEEIEEAYRKLAEAQGRLVQAEKMASLGSLVAGVAHEMNNPLGALMGSVEVIERAGRKLMERLGAQPDGTGTEREGVGRALSVIGESCENAHASASRLASIVETLKVFARLDRACIENADINEGLENTLFFLEHETGERVSVTKEFGDLPLVPCCIRDINQVFMNVLKNAIEAIEGEGEITVATRTENDSAFIVISDTGRGIPTEQIGRIFDPGYTTKGVRYGLGLGLSTAFRIVEEHGGRIVIESEEGTGTTCTIEIPLKRP